MLKKETVKIKVKKEKNECLKKRDKMHKVYELKRKFYHQL